MKFFCAVIFFMAGDFWCNGVTSHPDPPVNLAPTTHVACESFCSFSDFPVCSFRTGPSGDICQLFPCLRALNGHNCELNNAGNVSEIMHHTILLSTCSGLEFNHEQLCNDIHTTSVCPISCSEGDPTICATKVEAGTRVCRKFLCRNVFNAHNCNLYVHQSAYMVESEDTSICHANLFDEGPCIYPPILPNCTRTCYARDPMVCADKYDDTYTTEVCRKFLCQNALEAYNCRYPGADWHHMYDTHWINCNHLALNQEGPCIPDSTTTHIECESYCSSSDQPVCSTRAGPSGKICQLFPCIDKLRGHNCNLNYSGNVEETMHYTSLSSTCNGLEFYLPGLCNELYNTSACPSSCSFSDPTICATRVENRTRICRTFLCRSVLDAYNCNLHVNHSAYMVESEDTSICQTNSYSDVQCNVPPNCTRPCAFGAPNVCAMRFDSGTIMCRKLLCRYALDAYNCNPYGNFSGLMYYFHNSSVCNHLLLDQEGPCNLNGTLSDCTSSCSAGDPTVCSIRTENGHRICRRFLCRSALDAHNCNLDINDSAFMVETEEDPICHATSFDEGTCIDTPTLPNCTSACYDSDPIICAHRYEDVQDGGFSYFMCRKFLCLQALEAYNCRFPGENELFMEDPYFSDCSNVTLEEEGPCNYNW